MKNGIYILIFLALILSITGCSNKEPDSVSGGKEEVYITAGLKVRPLRDIKFESTPERIARGKYLANGASHCFLCHSERDWTKPGAPPIESLKGSGNVLLDQDGLRIVAPNITPDKETGAGSWTDDMFARAIREGVGHDGRPLYPLMLYQEFKHFSDEDVASIVVYLRTLPAIKNKLPKNQLPLEVQKMIVHLPLPIYKQIPEADFSNIMERGKYMTEIGGCIGCHTSWDTQLKPGLFAGGLFIADMGDSAFTINITPDESGLYYDEDAFITVIRTGKGGTLHSIMPWIVIKNYTDEDLRAIYKYLRSVKPVRHYINNFSKPTYCKLCGQVHGLGNMNTEKMTTTFLVKPAIYDTYTGIYTSNEGDSLTLFLEGDSLRLKDNVQGFTTITTKLLPVSKTEYASVNLPFNIKFGQDENGKATLIYNMFDDIVCKKVK